MCTTCSQRAEFKAICEKAEHFNSLLERRYGRKTFAKGGNLFLGRHYAASRTILFTSNPGMGPKKLRKKSNTSLCDCNHHWEGSQSNFRNWRFSKHFFESAFRIAPHFCKLMSEATDIFLIPWRTRDANELKKQPTWEDIATYSRRLVLQMLTDNDAELVPISGSETVKLFQKFIDTSLSEYEVASYLGNPKYRGRFDCRKFVLNKLHLSNEIVLRGVTIVQIPHFSRGVYAPLQEGGAL